MAQSVGAEEYTDCLSTEGWYSPNEYPGYYTKQSDDQAPVMLKIWGVRNTPFIAISPWSTLVRSFNTS